MKHKELSEKIIVITFSIAIFIIIILGSLNMMIFNKEFYYREYSKSGIYKNLPTDVDARNVTNNVLKYFRNTAELGYFTEDEKSHMRDVKDLIHVMQIIYYSAAALSIGLFYYCYRRFRHDKYHFIKILSNILLYSSIAAATFMILIFLASVFNFEIVFRIFHLIFFPQGNWMFDSSSLLITVFPEQFFFDISLRIFIYAIFQAIIFFGIGYWMRRQLKIVEKHNPFR
jgi:integral membrane protein (TIGR01906 family)